MAISEIFDARSDPEHLGVYAGQAIRAPADRTTWLNNMVLGLEARGVTPILPGASPPGSAHSVRFVVEKAWVAHAHDDIGAGVLLRLDELRDGRTTQFRFRGAKQKMVYFSANVSKTETALNSAVGEALDAMAAHLRESCGLAA
ncbi:MAG: hypothetical protein QM676_08780 [Novosphingobium sp.]